MCKRWGRWSVSSRNLLGSCPISVITTCIGPKISLWCTPIFLAIQIFKGFRIMLGSSGGPLLYMPTDLLLEIFRRLDYLSILHCRSVIINFISSLEYCLSDHDEYTGLPILQSDNTGISRTYIYNPTSRGRSATWKHLHRLVLQRSARNALEASTTLE